MDDLFVCCEEIGLPFKCNVLQTLNSFFDILSGADNKTQEQRRKIGEEEKFAEKAPQKIDNIIISVKLSSCIIAGIKVQIEFHVILGWKSKRLILVGYLEKSNKFGVSIKIPTFKIPMIIIPTKWYFDNFLLVFLAVGIMNLVGEHLLVF